MWDTFLELFKIFLRKSKIKIDKWSVLCLLLVIAVIAKLEWWSPGIQNVSDEVKLLRWWIPGVLTTLFIILWRDAKIKQRQLRKTSRTVKRPFLKTILFTDANYARPEFYMATYLVLLAGWAVCWYYQDWHIPNFPKGTKLGIFVARMQGEPDDKAQKALLNDLESEIKTLVSEGVFKGDIAVKTLNMTLEDTVDVQNTFRARGAGFVIWGKPNYYELTTIHHNIPRNLFYQIIELDIPEFKDLPVKPLLLFLRGYLYFTGATDKESLLDNCRKAYKKFDEALKIYDLSLKRNQMTFRFFSASARLIEADSLLRQNPRPPLKRIKNLLAEAKSDLKKCKAWYEDFASQEQIGLQRARTHINLAYIYKLLHQHWQQDSLQLALTEYEQAYQFLSAHQQQYPFKYLLLLNNIAWTKKYLARTREEVFRNAVKDYTRVIEKGQPILNTLEKGNVFRKDILYIIGKAHKTLLIACFSEVNYSNSNKAFDEAIRCHQRAIEFFNSHIDTYRREFINANIDLGELYLGHLSDYETISCAQTQKIIDHLQVALQQYAYVETLKRFDDFKIKMIEEKIEGLEAKQRQMNCD